MAMIIIINHRPITHNTNLSQLDWKNFIKNVFIIIKQSPEGLLLEGKRMCNSTQTVADMQHKE